MVQPNSALPIRRRPPVVRTTLMNAAAAHRGLGTRMSQLANPGSAPQLQASHDAALRGVTIIVLWATLWFTRNFITSDKQFPVEATLPAVYLAGYLFVNRDELRILRLPFLVDSALASLASALFIDTALGEVLLPALTLVCGLQWAQMRVGFAVLCGLCYFGYYAVFGTPSAEPRHLGVQISTLVSIGIALALFMRANRILLGTRTAAQEHVTTFINKAKTVRGASGLLWLLSVLRPVVASTGVRGALVWLGAMFVDWHYRVSIGGLVTSSCLLIGFGASLAPERASGVSARTRYLYGVLLIVAVWACDVSVFLAVPSYTLPFISNCVLSAYCVLHMSTSPVHLPRVTTVASSGAVEITPAPAPFATPVLGSVMLWSFMILADLHVQIRLGWEEPSMGRIVVAVNTIGYGVLLLTSSFLDAFSRDARIRARMSYLAEEAISADAIALRQLVDDFEGVPDFDVALATAGIRGDIKDVLMDARFVSHHATSGLVLGQQSAFEASKDDEQPVASATTDTAAADSDESHSDASTTAHGTSTPSAAVIETKATRSPDQRSPTGSFNHVPNATAAVSQPAAPPRESAEDIAAREKARLEAEEARRKAKLAQKAEEKRLQDQRALEAAQRRERQRREQELKDISVNEKSARDVLVSLERSVRDRVSSDFTQEINAVHEAVQARRQREAAKKSQRAQNATPPAAVAPSPQPAPTTAPVLVTPAPKSTAKTASPTPEAQPPKPQPPAPKQTSKAASRSTSEPPAKVSASAATATNGQPKQQQQQQTKKNNADKAATAASKTVAEPVAKPAKEPAHKDGTQQSKGNRGWEAQAAQAAPTQSKAVPQAQQARLPEPKSSRAQHNGPLEVVPAPSRTPPSASAPRVAPLLTPAAPSKSPVEACDEEGDAVNLLLAALHRNNNNNSGAAMPTSTTSSKSAAAFSPVASTPVQSSFAAGQVASETSKVADDEDDAEDFMSFINDQVNNVLKDDDGSHRAAHHQSRGVNDMDYHIGGSSSNGVNPAAPSFHMTSTPQSISPSLSPMRGPTQAHHQFGAPRAPMMEPTNFVAPMQPQYVAYSPQYVFVSPNGATAAQPQQMMYVQYIPYGGQMVPAYYVVPQGVVPTGPQPEEQVPPQM